MPTLNTVKPDPIRTAIIGPPFTRKTWWSLRAAELGYNVILADFDNGASIASALPSEALARIFRIDLRGTEDGSVSNASFAAFMLAAAGEVVYYDDASRKRIITARIEPEATYTAFNLHAATDRDVLVLDSWTVISALIKEYLANKSDPLLVPDYNIEQSEYNKMRMLADRLLSNLRKLPCHVIVIAHSQEWAKRKADAGSKDKPETAIEFIKQTAISVTKAHGEVLLGWANDALLFDIANAMQGVYISTKGGPEATAGSRTLPPQRKPWEEFGIEKLLPALDAAEISPSFTSKAVRTVRGEDLIAEIAEAKANKPKPKLNAAKTPLMKLGK